MDNTYLVVQEREAEKYEKYEEQGCHLLILPPEIEKLSPTRQYLLEFHRDNFDPDETLVLLDDDLTFAKRETEGSVKLTAATGEALAPMFALLDKAIQEDGFVHAGISAREGNNRIEQPSKEIGRMMRLLAYNAHKVLELGCRFDRISTKQDFDMTLQLLRKGEKNHILYDWAHNQAGSNVTGGVSGYRTPEVQKQDSEKLAELHDGFVDVVKKVTKSSWGGTERFDVRIGWKKAFNSSQAG
jgi:hypothetical protein